MSSSSAVFHPKVAEVVAGREVFFQYNALLRLTLRLLVESLDGYLSPFHSYIATLPPTPWSPLAYKADLMEPYRKALTTVEIMEHTRHVTRLYHTIYKHLGVTTFLNRNTFTWAAFRWAYSTVLSRAVALPLPTPSLLGANVRGGIQEYGLVPMVDLVNFSPTGPMPLYNPTTACLEIVAPAPLAAGSEVRPSNRLTVQLFVRWPILNNRELLLRYGVCSDRLLANDALRLTVSLPAVNRDAESWERYVLCQSIRVPSSNAFPLHRAPVARTSRELLQYILLVALDVETLRQVTSRAELRPAPGRPFLRDRAQALRHLDATLGEPPTEGGGVAPATPALRTALSWLRVTLQVHLRLALRVDLDALLRPLDLGDPSTYPTRWFLQALRHEQRFVRSAIDEFDVLLGGKSILDD
ncbi:Histone-lysine N-methyltransferase setd3 [Massospora cicadina]|nr:Histone-lysine N-methyltransferase setd3 [Massospora cicadina]